MKTLKIFFVILLSSAFTLTSCSKKDDDGTPEEPQDALVSIGVCGEFFNGTNLTVLCGVTENNTQSFGDDETVCTYIIREKASDDPELYTATIWTFDNVSEAKDFYNGVRSGGGQDGTITPLSGLGDEAVWIVDSDTQEYAILFRYKNLSSIVTTDELHFELGCTDPQGTLKQLSNIILNKL